jgi:hypothetical protein
MSDDWEVPSNVIQGSQSVLWSPSNGTKTVLSSVFPDLLRPRISWNQQICCNRISLMLEPPDQGKLSWHVPYILLDATWNRALYHTHAPNSMLLPKWGGGPVIPTSPVGSGGSEDENEPVPPSPMRELWALHPEKGHVDSQVMAPWGCLKNARRLISKRLSQDCVYVAAEIC